MTLASCESASGRTGTLLKFGQQLPLNGYYYANASTNYADITPFID